MENRRDAEAQRTELNAMTEKIIGCAIEVHRVLGPGLLESVYEACLCYELSKAGLNFRRQIDLPVRYKDVTLDCGFRIDVLVEESVLVESKATERVLPVHLAQLLTHVKLLDLRVGLLIDFNVPVLRDGIHRVVNKF